LTCRDVEVLPGEVTVDETYRAAGEPWYSDLLAYLDNFDRLLVSVGTVLLAYNVLTEISPPLASFDPAPFFLYLWFLLVAFSLFALLLFGASA